jgi:hypothetical protein
MLPRWYRNYSRSRVTYDQFRLAKQSIQTITSVCSVDHHNNDLSNLCLWDQHDRTKCVVQDIVTRTAEEYLT